jgi:hypothetical protein
MCSSRSYRTRMNSSPGTNLMVSFWRVHRNTKTAPHNTNDKPEANGAPAGPMRGAPKLPRMKAYSRGRLTRLTANPNNSGVHALPAARSALDRMISMAKPMMKVDNQNIFRAANSSVAGSNPKRLAI